VNNDFKECIDILVKHKFKKKTIEEAKRVFGLVEVLK